MCRIKVSVFIGVQWNSMSRNLLQFKIDGETLNEKLHHTSISFPVKNKNHNEKGKKINLSIDFFGYEVQYFIHTYQRKNLLHKLAYYNK